MKSTITVILSSSPYISRHFCFMYFAVVFFTAQRSVVILSSLEIVTFMIKKNPILFFRISGSGLELSFTLKYHPSCFFSCLHFPGTSLSISKKCYISLLSG